MAHSRHKKHSRSGVISSNEHASDEDEITIDENVEEPAAGGGLAEVFARILTKKIGDKTPILAKGKTDKQIRKRKLEREINESGSNTDNNVSGVITLNHVKPSIDEIKEHPRLNKQALEAKKVWESMSHVKPDITKKDYEKQLQRTATMGVVQLFNAVRKQQQTVEEKLEEAGKSISRQEKVLKSMTKGQFLDMLKTTGSKMPKQLPNKRDDDSDDDTCENDNKQKKKPSWSVLKDDFMMGANMKDWDKIDDDEGVGDEEQANYDSASSD